LAGKADVAVNDTDEVLLARAQGADIKVFMANATKVDYTLVAANPEIKEAKDLVEGAPTTVKEGLPKDEADALKTKLEEVGATVEIK